MENLISRRQFNDRRKFTAELCKKIRKRIASKMDSAEEYFCIDSKPIEICRSNTRTVYPNRREN